MTTATKTKAEPDVLAELERLDAALAEAEQAAKEAGEEHDRVNVEQALFANPARREAEKRWLDRFHGVEPAGGEDGGSGDE